MTAKSKYKNKRILVQLGFFALFIFVVWSTRYPLKNFISASWLFQIDPLVMGITAIAERVLLPGILLSLLAVLITAVFGRVFCGWFCPLGASMDLFRWLFAKAKTLSFREKNPLRWVYLKYIILGVLVVASVLGLQLAWTIDPITIFVRAASFTVFPYFNKAIEQFFAFLLKSTDFYFPLESIYLALKENFLPAKADVFSQTAAAGLTFLGILLLAFFKRRFWCRYLCPLGALLALFGKISRLVRIAEHCTEGCVACKNKCRMNAIKADNTYLKEECVLCMDCVDDCPAGSSKFKFK